jgi:hypothetical protein
VHSRTALVVVAESPQALRPSFCRDCCPTNQALKPVKPENQAENDAEILKTVTPIL